MSWEPPPPPLPPPPPPPPSEPAGELPGPPPSEPAIGSAPGEPPAPPPRRSRLLALVVAGLVLVSGLGVGGYLLVSGGGDEGNGAETPAQAVRGFYTGMDAGDCHKAASFVDPSFLTENRICNNPDVVKKGIGTLDKIVETQTHGQTADVVAERTLNDVTDNRLVHTSDKGSGWVITGGSACYPIEHPKDLGNAHLKHGEKYTDYSSNPPTSGPHDPVPTKTGIIYAEPQPNEQLVHAMEHGAVIFWRKAHTEVRKGKTLWITDLSKMLDDEVESKVGDIFHANYSSLIITPYPELDVPFAMTAWGTLQRCVGVDGATIKSFVQRFYASGQEGALACQNESATVPACQKNA